MSPYDRAVADAKLGIKALQNMAASVKYLELMASTRDQWLLSSLFCSAVVRYARPFSQPPAGRGNRAYPEKQLKRRAGLPRRKTVQRPWRANNPGRAVTRMPQIQWLSAAPQVPALRRVKFALSI